jgi:hypothetical protein
LRFQIGLPLLVLLLASPLAAQTGAPAPLVHAGSLSVDGDPAAVSYLPLDTSLLKDKLCSKDPTASWGTITPRGECDLSVSPPRLGFTTEDSVTVSGGSVTSSIQVSLQAGSAGTWTASGPLSTACGLWDISMTLDPSQEQTASEISLEPSGTGTAQGVFAGTAPLAVLYRFVNRDHGTTLELPAVLPLELSGHWAAASTAGLSPGASNLLLYAGVVDGEISPFPACGTWGGTRCHVCLTLGSGEPEGLRPTSKR